jgi:HTH-type transcriptional regulator / antitoxin HipB
VDYPVQIISQLRQLLKSLRKSRQMTQAELARRLGVVQSRVADIERDPGAVSVEQLLQVLAMLGAQMVVRDTRTDARPIKQGTELPVDLKSQPSLTANLSVEPKPQSKDSASTSSNPSDSPPPDEPRGQW